MAARFSALPREWWPQSWWPAAAQLIYNKLMESSSVIMESSSTEQIVQVIEYNNPEIKLPKLLQEYFQDFDINNIHPNFPIVRVGNAHPFAMLLYQTASGQNLDSSLFPSITIMDSSGSQTAMELSNAIESGIIHLGDPIYNKFRSAIINGDFLTSIENLFTLDNAISAQGFIIFKSTKFITSNTVDCNIWSENKDYTSELYDVVKQYFIDNKISLETDQGLHILEGISGRRSGDINLDFGKLLYGANITMSMNIEHRSYNFDISDVIIKNVGTNINPEFEGVS